MNSRTHEQSDVCKKNRNREAQIRWTKRNIFFVYWSTWCVNNRTSGCCSLQEIIFISEMVLSLLVGSALSLIIAFWIDSINLRIQTFVKKKKQPIASLRSLLHLQLCLWYMISFCLFCQTISLGHVVWVIQYMADHWYRYLCYARLMRCRGGLIPVGISLVLKWKAVPDSCTSNPWFSLKSKKLILSVSMHLLKGLSSRTTNQIVKFILRNSCVTSIYTYRISIPIPARRSCFNASS